MLSIFSLFNFRLVTEEDAVRIYHSLENERLYHAKDPQFIEISAEVRYCLCYEWTSLLEKCLKPR